MPRKSVQRTLAAIYGVPWFRPSTCSFPNDARSQSTKPSRSSVGVSFIQFQVTHYHKCDLIQEQFSLIRILSTPSQGFIGLQLTGRIKWMDGQPVYGLIYMYVLSVIPSTAYPDPDLWRNLTGYHTFLAFIYQRGYRGQPIERVLAQAAEPHRSQDSVSQPMMAVSHGISLISCPLWSACGMAGTCAPLILPQEHAGHPGWVSRVLIHERISSHVAAVEHMNLNSGGEFGAKTWKKMSSWPRFCWCGESRGGVARSSDNSWSHNGTIYHSRGIFDASNKNRVTFLLSHTIQAKILR